MAPEAHEGNEGNNMDELVADLDRAAARMGIEINWASGSAQFTRRDGTVFRDHYSGAWDVHGNELEDARLESEYTALPESIREALEVCARAAAAFGLYDPELRHTFRTLSEDEHRASIDAIRYYMGHASGHTPLELKHYKGKLRDEGIRRLCKKLASAWDKTLRAPLPQSGARK